MFTIIYQKLQSSAEHNETPKIKKDFLTNYIPKTSHFYGLPKIHKSEEIKKNCRNKNLNT